MTSMNPDPDRRRAGSAPGDGGNGTTKRKLEEDARDAKREAGARVREKAEAGQERLAGEADALSDAIDAAASELADHDRDGLARYARTLSRSIADAAGQIESRSVDQLANDAKRLARDNPPLFVLGSIAVGFGLSRFFKASAERDDQAGAPASRNEGERTRETAPTTTNGHGTPPRRPGTDPYTTAAASRSDDGREML